MMTDETETTDNSHGIGGFLNKILSNTLNEGSHFTLSQQTITALDILPKLSSDGLLPETVPVGGTSRSDTTLFAILNKCRTVSGRRLLIKWLKNPLKSKEKIDTRLDIVQHFVDNTELRNVCYDDYLRKSGDLMKLSFKVQKESSSITELVNIFKTCKSLQKLEPNFKQILAISGMEAPAAMYKLISWINSSCVGLREFCKVIEDTIDIDNEDEAGDLTVKPDSSEDIAKISLDITSLCNEARQVLSQVARDIHLEAEKTVKLEIDSTKGFALKVTKVHEQAVRGNPDYEQLSLVKKDGYRFTNRKLTRLSSKYISTKEEYNSFAKNIILDVIREACMFDAEVQEFAMAVSMLDVFVALSMTAIQNNYVRPLILDSVAGRLSFERLRHPCIENQPDVENYVPNDITMSKHDKKFYIITGPNMGGKSTFIKSVAIGVLMAQCGCFIPADDGRVSVVNGVYTRVGAGDSLMEGVSTFMEEMLDMAKILKGADENSLVIIDELGRGTSTFDGFGLAWSISKHLATESKCYTLFATHFHELTEMEEEISGVGNLHVKALCQDNKLTMMYNVGVGICDESYGINVAEFTRFPRHVVENARDKLKQFEEVPGFGGKKEVREFVRECIREHLA